MAAEEKTKEKRSMQIFKWNNMTGLLGDHVVLLSLLAGLSLLMFVGSLIAVPLVVVRLPQDYLIREHRLVRTWPWHISLSLLILKNVLGAVFLLSGLAMLILPGQGLLTMFIGLVLIDFPGKRILIRRILGHRRILPVINRLCGGPGFLGHGFEVIDRDQGDRFDERRFQEV